MADEKPVGQVRRTTLRQLITAHCTGCGEMWEAPDALQIAADHAEVTGHAVGASINVAYRFEAVTG